MGTWQVQWCLWAWELEVLTPLGTQRMKMGSLPQNHRDLQQQQQQSHQVVV
jgi:hypothetical protein